MRLVVLRQVVAPHEALLTLVALKALVSCQGGGRERDRQTGQDRQADRR